MSKRQVKSKPKRGWKFYTLASSASLLIVGLIIAFFLLGANLWLHSIMLPTILSGAVGVGVSMWFTVRSDKERLVDELNKEIDGVFRHFLRLQRVLVEIPQNPLYSNLLKKQIICQEIIVTPDMYRIREKYRHLWTLYKDKKNEMLDLVKKWDINQPTALEHFYATMLPNLHLHIAMISGCALEVQELFLGDFKGAKTDVHQQNWSSNDNDS